MKSRTNLFIGMLIFIIYCLIIILSNYFMSKADTLNNENYEMISGILFGFIGIPIFSIIVPIYLANKWKLDYSIWPKSKNAFLVVIFIVCYIILTNYTSFKYFLTSTYTVQDYIIHYTSTLLFHVTYYPLFLIFLFPVLRANFGLWIGIISTSILFALYHLTQYYFFPAGTTLLMQIVLTIAFAFNILIYLWSESILLVSLLHSTNGAIGLIANGTIFNEVDFVFYLTIVIVVSLFLYYLIKETNQRKTKEYNDEWWIHFKKF